MISPTYNVAFVGEDKETQRTLWDYLATLPGVAAHSGREEDGEPDCLIVDEGREAPGLALFAAGAHIVALRRRGGSAAAPEEDGAHRILHKPFRLAQLGAALESLARARGEAARPLAGPLLLREREVLHEKTGASVTLTEKERQLLLALLEREGETVARETLLAEVWKYQQGVSTRTLETHASRLRGKLQDLCGETACPILILAEPGGYRATRS